jgi:hypothetical protein
LPEGFRGALLGLGFRCVMATFFFIFPSDAMIGVVKGHMPHKVADHKLLTGAPPAA